MILKVMKAVQKKYILALVNAPSRRTYVLSQQVATKFDLRKDYIANMKALSEVASQAGEQEAVDFAKGVLSSQVEELKALIEEAKGE